MRIIYCGSFFVLLQQRTQIFLRDGVSIEDYYRAVDLRHKIEPFLHGSTTAQRRIFNAVMSLDAELPPVPKMILDRFPSVSGKEHDVRYAAFTEP